LPGPYVPARDESITAGRLRPPAADSASARHGRPKGKL